MWPLNLCGYYRAARSHMFNISPFFHLCSIASAACTSRIPEGEHYACTSNIVLS